MHQTGRVFFVRTHQHESVGELGRPRVARACDLFTRKTSFRGFRSLFALLAILFLLVSCEPPGSPSAPRKKREAEALQALEKEIDDREAYAAAVPAGQKVETAMSRLLRRIVVLGVMTEAEQKAELKRLLQEWRDAKKSLNR